MVVNKRYRSRRGLAPVELVLAIPLVMFTVALSVIVGTASCWKIRASVVARNEIWTYRMPRDDAPPNPRPEGWPVGATANHYGGGPMTELNHPAFQNPIVRGPLSNINVNANRFDPTAGVRVGHSHIDRTPAMLPRIGQYQFDLEHRLLDGKWQYRQMGLASNGARRVPGGYPSVLRPDQNPARQVAMQIAGAPFRSDLDVLDHDEELRAWRGNYVEFHPTMRSFCHLDPERVRAENILGRRGLLEAIERIPRSMTNTFLSMYRAQLASLPQPPAVLMPAQAALKAELEQKIAVLEDYLASLN
jgi:hypothetical protein